MADRITKGYVVSRVTRQSQRAQGITRAFRAHAWRTDSYGNEHDDEWRHDQLRLAVRAQRAIVRDAAAVLSWVEEYARQEGALGADE